MEGDRSIGKADRIAVFAMVLALVACGVIGISKGDASFDTSEWSAAPPDSAAAPVPADDVRLIASKSASQEWFADDSAQGTRPDSSH